LDRLGRLKSGARKKEKNMDKTKILKLLNERKELALKMITNAERLMEHYTDEKMRKRYEKRRDEYLSIFTELSTILYTINE
jgi:hypothetical protein